MKAVLLALALSAVSAAGAAANGKPGPPPGGKSSGAEPQGKGESGDNGGGAHDGRTAERAFGDQLTALGYTCARRPLMVRGSLTAVGTDSLTLHPLRGTKHGRAPTATDLTAKVISTTQVRRRGPATVASLVVGDMVELQAVACRTAGANAGTPPTLVARLVNARPPQA